MASIAFVVIMTDGTQMTRKAEVSDGDVARLLEWGMATFPDEFDAGSIVDGGVDEKGVALPPVVVPPKALLKDPPWVVKRWIEGIVAETFAKVNAFELNVAAQAAQDSVKPIEVKLS